MRFKDRHMDIPMLNNNKLLSWFPYVETLTPPIPSNAYVAEDGTTPYVAEDGTTVYVQETP